MIIDNEIKLDFKDVLIRPKRSTLKSRSEVDLHRHFKFKHVNDYNWKGVPLMVSNMDTTGTFEMAKEVSKYEMFTCIHKHYSIEDWKNFKLSMNKGVNINNYLDEWKQFNPGKDYNIFNYIAISCGSKVIGWDHGGTKEILEDLFQEGLVELENIDKLKEKVLKISNKDFITPKENTFTSKRMTEETINLYYQLLNQQ